MLLGIDATGKNVKESWLVGKMMTKHEWYTAVAEAKEKGRTVEDCLDAVLQAVIEGTATCKELMKYAGWSKIAIDRKKVKKFIKKEPTKTTLEKLEASLCNYDRSESDDVDYEKFEDYYDDDNEYCQY